MRPFYTLFIVFLLSPVLLFAQSKTQSMRGIVVDKDSHQPLIGASIVLKNSTPIVGTTSDEEGHFSLAKIPVGRQALQISYVGYEPFVTEEFIVTTAKELIINIELKENAHSIGGVEITYKNNHNAPINELAVVSTRSFSVEETDRIAASVNDPGRMALSYPGVGQGRDDTENDIIIRGNSSFGMLWRLEGIDIPNPNHFARPGTSGGGITVFSAQLLSRSDFSTGGMPAEYGNAISGAMDIHFRKGNKEKRENRIKIGLLGLDFATEGPLKKERSSYLVNYRYSTLGLLNSIGFHLVGDRVSNDFQDLSFNLSLDSKDKRNLWTVFGLGGISKERYTPVEDPTKREYGIGNQWEDRQQSSDMGALGMTYTRLIDDKSHLKWVVALMGSHIYRIFDTLNVKNERYRYNTQQYYDTRLSSSLTYTRKLNSSTRLQSGLIFHQIFFDFFKETAPRSASSDITASNFVRHTSFNGRGATQTAQGYAQLSHQITPKMSLNVGVHTLHLFLNNTSSIEPRFSIKQQLSARQSLSFAYGLHGQILPLSAYFFTKKDTLNGQIIDNQPNKNLKLVKSNHFILSYNYVSPNDLKWSIETYFQQLSKVPVQENATSLYWMLNEQQEFPEFKVINTGKGRNYGVDASVEKFFSKRFYFLLSASYFKATYAPYNGTYYNSKFGTTFVSGLTAGKEFTFKNASVLQIGFRSMFNGGFRYTPLDVAKAATTHRYEPLLGQEWSKQVAPYRRIDARIAYTRNKRGFSSVLALDIQNLTNYHNLSYIGYDPNLNNLYFGGHPSGFTPILSYRFDF
jgi:CarboxypepD_reg-like domain